MSHEINLNFVYNNLECTMYIPFLRHQRERLNPLCTSFSVCCHLMKKIRPNSCTRGLQIERNCPGTLRTGRRLNSNMICTPKFLIYQYGGPLILITRLGCPTSLFSIWFYNRQLTLCFKFYHLHTNRKSIRQHFNRFFLTEIQVKRLGENTVHLQ